MINQVYQLTAPRVITVKYDDITFGDKVIVRPEYMAICHADQRYFQGQRDIKVLKSTEILYSPLGTVGAVKTFWFLLCSFDYYIM